jgi:hypothetical protein
VREALTAMMPHQWFCTLFDRNYLFKGVALYRSLERWSREFTLVILCMDDIAYDTLAKLALPRARLVRLQEFEDPELLRAKATRSMIEYYWTCTPSLPLFVLDRIPVAQAVTYLDADLFFYGDPQALLAEMATASIMIHEHRFPPRLAEQAQYTGIYNVAWVTFRRDDNGLACASRWREQCIEWCYYRHEDGRMGDQKYLDTWTRDFGGVHVLRHKGGGLAPWNVEQYRIERRGDGAVYVDDDPLIFYHFHGLRLFVNGTVFMTNASYPLREEDRRLLYQPYIEALWGVRDDVQRVVPEFTHGLEQPEAKSAKEELLASRAPRVRGIARLRRPLGRIKRWLIGG